jgi:hypothetical protein
MEPSFLFVHKSDEFNNENNSINYVREKAKYSDKETLIKSMEALIDYNKRLKQYIELLENQLSR